ncbi:unnamed protein product [Soboliphyme baturini]|uniref:Mediator of RNA polymerase II transcription subunit 22 n=1 Tax=Soboliphyme baturini TaxID=241478 RepID=A0A183IKW9_9BILA|nr:unnamed protein product [Soboliphyme baturini]
MVEEESQVLRLTNYEQRQYEMQIRTANMTRCAEALIKLVSDLKQFLILNDFEFVNETVEFTNSQCQLIRKELNDKLLTVKEEAAVCLQEAEQEYYNTSLQDRTSFIL